MSLSTWSESAGIILQLLRAYLSRQWRGNNHQTTCTVLLLNQAYYRQEKTCFPVAGID